MKNSFFTILLFALGLLLSCSNEDSDTAASIEILSSSVNGANSNGTNIDVPIETSVEFVFSAALNTASFQSALTVQGGSQPVDFDVVYSNATTKATVNMTLDYNTSYTVNLANNEIGARGERLRNSISFSFTTAEDDVIRSMNPCTNVGDCLRSVELEGSQGNGTFEFYSNYPIYEDKAEWENLTHAVIVVHGASHDPQNYYGYMTNTFQAQSVSESTVLIAPFFRSTSTGSADDFFWSNTSWRRGSPSSNTNKLSSFEAIDAIIDQLSDKNRFPVLQKIVITGHSSGAAFTHVYSAANRSEAKHPSMDFEYVVANSQFFYYPDGRRINESNNQLYTPAGCAGYNIWPLGYNATPAYLSGVNSSAYNSQFVSRKVTYLLGNGNQSDPTLNTQDCENTLQGSSRFRRGDNMFKYMELAYPSTHNHKRVIVNGIGHDGQGMYQSNEFKSFLTQLLN